MGEQTDHTELAFFGTVTASISHEIKNRMAIINEQAGLLEDYVAMAERGKEIDLVRLKRLSGSVREQVAIGDRILRNMNQFAHSVDTPCTVVDLRSLLELTAALAARLASLKGVKLEVDLGGEKAEVATSPFTMMNLVWVCLDAALETAAPGSALVLCCDHSDGDTVIRIRGDVGSTGEGAASPAAAAESLAAALGAELACGAGDTGIEIRMPSGGNGSNRR